MTWEYQWYTLLINYNNTSISINYSSSQMYPLKIQVNLILKVSNGDEKLSFLSTHTAWLTAMRCQFGVFNSPPEGSTPVVSPRNIPLHTKPGFAKYAVDANLFPLESSILTRAKRATNRNNAAKNQKNIRFFRGGTFLGGICRGGTFRGGDCLEPI